MKGMISKKKVTEQARTVNIRAVVQSLAHLHQTSINKTSARLGYTESYLNTVLKKKDHHISLLIALSMHFQSNLLETYFQLLPANLRITRREKDLLKQVDEMEKQLMDVIKERDMLKEILMKK